MLTQDLQMCANGLVSGVVYAVQTPQHITWLRYLGSEGKRGRVNDSMGYANERCTNTVQQCASELRCLLLIWGQCVRLSFFGYYGLRHTGSQ